MTAGPGSRPSAEDLKLEEKIKNLSYEYPVSFPVFWNRVRAEINERGSKNLFAPRNAWAFAATAAAVVVLSAFLFLNVRPAAQITMTQGHAEVRYAGSKSWHPLTLREKITAGMEVRTAGSGSVELQIDGNARIRLDENTSVTLEELGPVFRSGPTVVKLDQGTVSVLTRYARQDAKFVVLTSQLRITGGNNRMTVSRSADGDTAIAVQDAPAAVETVFQKPLQRLRPVLVEAGNQAFVSGSGMSALARADQKDDPSTLQKKYLSAVRTRTLSPDETSVRSGENNNWITGRTLVKASFISEPADARVILNGRAVGTTPLSILQEKDRMISVIMVKRGFAAFSTNILPTNDSVLSLPLSRDNAGSTADLSPFPERLEWFENLPAGVLQKPCVFNEGYVYCADGNTIKTFYNRKLVKSIQVSKQKISLTSPLYRNGRVYAASDNGGLYAYSPSSDEVTVLKEGGKNTAVHQPVAAGDWILLVSEDQGVELFGQDGRPGMVILQDEVKKIISEPYYSDKKGLVVLATADERVIAYDVRKNRTAWMYKGNRDKISDPLAGNDQSVFVYSGQTGTVTAFRLSDGKLLWKKTLPDTAGSGIRLVADNERLFITSVTGSKTGFIVMNAAYGNTEFRKDFPGELLAPVLMAGKTVLISKTGRTALYEPAIQEIEYNSILK